MKFLSSKLNIVVRIAMSFMKFDELMFKPFLISYTKYPLGYRTVIHSKLC